MLSLVHIALASLAPTGEPHFGDITEAAGLSTAISVCPATPFGGAAVWIDWDGDPFPDLLLGESHGDTRLYLNHGTLPFEDATPPELAAVPNLTCITPFSLPPAPGDKTGTPRPALLLTQHLRKDDVDLSGLDAGSLHIFELPAPGSGGVARPVPVGRPTPCLALGSSGDWDGDGVMDLFVGSHACGAGSVALRTVFRMEYGSQGYAMSDTDPILAPGCTPLPMLTDFDNNGRPLLMVTTDYGGLETPSALIRHGQAPSALPGVYGMGSAVGDVDHDGLMDYVLTSIGPDLLVRTRAGEPSVDVLARATEWGYDGTRFKWGLAFLDADNDGDEELWLTAGAPAGSGAAEVEDDESVVLVPEPNPRDSFLSDGLDIADKAGLTELTSKRSVALADVDADGRMDALITGMNYRMLYHNVTPNAGHWVAFKVPDRPAARYFLEACGRVMQREFSGQQGAGMHQRLVHFGLGDCTGPVHLTVRWPWLGESEPETYEIDQQYVVDDPGNVWIEPSEVAPGGTVRVRSTLRGETRVDGHVIEPQGVTFEAPINPGTYQHTVEWNGRAIDLSPKLRVVADGPQILTDPSPVRLGAPFRIVSSSGPVQAVSGVAEQGQQWMPTESPFQLKVGDKPLTVYPINNFGPETRAILTEDFNGSGNVLLAMVDGLGAPSSSVGDTLRLRQEGGKLTTFEHRVAPWYLAYFDHGAPPSGQVVVGDHVLLPVAVRPIVREPIDVNRSRVWIVKPIARADGQDTIRVVLLARDAEGHVVEPGPEYLPSAPGMTLISDSWRRVRIGFEMMGYSARLRVGTTPGPVPITVGPLSGVAWLVEDDSPVPTPASTMEVDGNRTRLIPRNRLGQRLGSGVVTDPPFDYWDNGVYYRDGIVETVRMGPLVGTMRNGEVVWAGGDAAASGDGGGCGVGASHRSGAVVLLVGVAALLLRRRWA